VLTFFNCEESHKYIVLSEMVLLYRKKNQRLTETDGADRPQTRLPGRVKQNFCSNETDSSGGLTLKPPTKTRVPSDC